MEGDSPHLVIEVAREVMYTGCRCYRSRVATGRLSTSSSTFPHTIRVCHTQTTYSIVLRYTVSDTYCYLFIDLQSQAMNLWLIRKYSV